MKYVIFGAILALIVGFSVSALAETIINLKSWDFKATIEASDGSLIRVYKVEDGDTTCYITHNRPDRVNVDSDISCVK